MSAPSSIPIIEAERLTKVFRDFWLRPKVRAVNEIDFVAGPGEVFGLLGPNGSGKSTTLKMILGLLRPSAGSLRVFGLPPRDVKSKARVGYLPEESYLYQYLTPVETLNFYGRLFDFDAATRRSRIEQLLEMVGLQYVRRRLIGEFSKGMARRLGLAQALINDPDLIILDEPTSGLDPVGCRQIKDLIRTLAGRGKTVILSSHLLADVEDVCDRVAIMCNGRIIVHGRIRELLEERERCRLTFPPLPPGVLEKAIETIRRELGLTPEIDHPTRKLEQYFIEAVEQARRLDIIQTGVAQTAGVADYLAGKAPDIPQQR